MWFWLDHWGWIVFFKKRGYENLGDVGFVPDFSAFFLCQFVGLSVSIFAANSLVGSPSFRAGVLWTRSLTEAMLWYPPEN